MCDTMIIHIKQAQIILNIIKSMILVAFCITTSFVNILILVAFLRKILT